MALSRFVRRNTRLLKRAITYSKVGVLERRGRLPAAWPSLHSAGLDVEIDAENAERVETSS